MIEYINQLLTTNSNVVIPGFGTFTKKSGNPPQLLFNAKKKSDDGLLVNHIREEESTDEATAKEKIALFVDHLKTNLEKEGEFALVGLGKFSKKRNDIGFEPDSSALSLTLNEKLAQQKKNLSSNSNKTIQNKKSEMNSTEEKRKGRDPIYITIIILLLLGGFLLLMQYLNTSSDLEACSENRNQLQDELLMINGMVGGSTEEISEDLTSDLQNMLDDYESVQTENSDYQDSIAKQKEEIETLLGDMKKYKNDRWKLYKAQKQIKSMRSVMKHYIHEIDSLNQVNLGLRNDLSATQDTLTHVSMERDDYIQKSSALESQVAIGSILQTANINSQAIRVTGGGTQRETNRAKRSSMIKSCFTILSNRIAKSGEKQIYMRVISPSGNVVKSNKSGMFKIGDTESLYSVSMTIDYQNKEESPCIYFDLQGQEIPEGKYITELYADGVLIGKEDLQLK